MGDLNDPFMRNRDAAVQARTKAQNRANVLQLKLIGQSHPTGLTSNLLKLFEPRPPLEYKPPPETRKCPSYTGMAQFVSNFAEPGDPEYAPPVQEAETPVQRRARIHRLRLEKGALKASEELEKYDPTKDPNISGDPYKTLFVARLNYETTEHRIKREFEAYGPIKRVRLITDRETNKPRGYAFVEYMHTRDMKTAYKQADGRKLDNKRVLVDVERGRTVPNWRPRRLGGGLGSTRIGGEEVNQKYSGREPQQMAAGGGPRSEEPRPREDRHVDREREKSRDRGKGRDREREKSRERSSDRVRDRDRDLRDDRHHKDRDRNRDMDRDRDRDRGRDRTRDRGDRDRDRGRDYDRDRERDRGRDRPRERERDYEHVHLDYDHGRAREKDSDRIEPKYERGHPGERDRELDHIEPEQDPEWDEHAEPGRVYGDHEPEHYDHYERPKDHDPYSHLEPKRELEADDDHEHYAKLGRVEPDDDHERYVKMEPDSYDERYVKLEPDDDYYERYDRAESEPRERERTRDKEREYQRSERSRSRDYGH
ncbi:U1 small nuclear ribonucleoprotein-70K [Tasmannia lanceolata]|uniref:U1 small nuclear ribonucleoprotein-70K n=1 Tax=Tasmannia lanceolata TaxID=3420 RepID=UPI004062F433